MNRNSKKGFTIVELIIVIAVIAVLAAVLIPTFSNLIQKANEAKDTALVSNLNKAVAMDTTSHDTMYDVLKVAEDVAGINVAKINAAANSNEILWDSVNKCFVYRVGEEIKYIPDTKSKDVAGNYDYWKISSNQEDVKANKYSIYWTGAALSEITATTGFDAGEAEIGKIIYQREDTATAQTVTIRTNGGELEVSAKPDTVYHYDVASKVVVTKVHNASYHENGTVVGNLEVKEGHVELCAKADVSTVIVAPTTANAATVTVTSGATVGVVAATTDEGKTYLDSATTVPADKKANKQLDDSVLNQFAGGIGTEASPYLIANAEQFLHIANFKDDMLKGIGTNFKLIADIDLSNSEYPFTANWWGNSYSPFFSGCLDGNGQTVKAYAEDFSYFMFGDLVGNVEIKDLVICHKESAGAMRLSNGNYAGARITYKNVDIISENANTTFELDNNDSFYVTFPGSHTFMNSNMAPATYLFEDCDLKVNGNSSGYSGLFLGQKIYGVSSRVVVKNCSYEGTFIGTQVSLIQGNQKNDGALEIIGFENKGTVGCTIGLPTIAGAAAINANTTIEPLSGNVTYSNCNWGIMTYLHDDKLDIKVDNGKLNITKASIANEASVTYAVTIKGGTRFYYDEEWNLTSAENSTFNFTIEVKDLNTPFEAGYLVTKKQFDELSLTNTTLIGEYTLVSGEKVKLIRAENNEVYYVFEFEGNFAFGTKDKEGNVTAQKVATKEAVVLCYNNGILAATDNCAFNIAK